jgi:hypothetical protein
MNISGNAHTAWRCAEPRSLTPSAIKVRHALFIQFFSKLFEKAFLEKSNEPMATNTIATAMAPKQLPQGKAKDILSKAVDAKLDSPQGKNWPSEEMPISFTAAHVPARAAPSDMAGLGNLKENQA